MTQQITYPRATFTDHEELLHYTLEFFPEATLQTSGTGEVVISTNLYELPDGSYAHRGIDDDA